MIYYLLILIILFSLIHQSFLFPKQVENFININETINQNQSLFHKNKRKLRLELNKQFGNLNKILRIKPSIN